MKTARQIAVEALGKVNGSKGYSNIVIDKALEQSGLGLRDAAFATALFYGVLERMLTLDHCIAGFSAKRVREVLSTGCCGPFCGPASGCPGWQEAGQISSLSNTPARRGWCSSGWTAMGRKIPKAF